MAALEEVDGSVVERAKRAVRDMFVGDALAMPAHWYYNSKDIDREFGGTIDAFLPAPARHPSSIMSLHSTARGGRGAQGEDAAEGKEIVGDVILKGKRRFWGVPNTHYHQGMKAGDNTLNLCCVRVWLRAVAAEKPFIDAYIDFMTTEGSHPDTYAESYHRGFFANLQDGKPKDQCGALTHDTPSIGGLVSVVPLALRELVRARDVPRVQRAVRAHLFLTHPSEDLARVADALVELLDGLLFDTADTSPRELIARAAKRVGVDDLASRVRQCSIACYITDSFPWVLHLAHTHIDDLDAALVANASLGGDNCHRGAVLGAIVALASQQESRLYPQLLHAKEIASEVDAAFQ